MNTKLRKNYRYASHSKVLKRLNNKILVSWFPWIRVFAAEAFLWREKKASLRNMGDFQGHLSPMMRKIENQHTWNG